MARACRFQFHLGPFRTAFLALLLIACPSGTAKAATKAEHLYLLAGRPTPNSASGFPVRLYTLSGDSLALVRQVAKGLFSVTDDLSGHLYVLSLSMRELSVIHEDAPEKVDVIPAPEGSGRSPRFDFYYPTWGAIAGAGVSPGIVFASHTDHWTVTRIFADVTPGQPRITAGSWTLYRCFKYEGGGGRGDLFPGDFNTIKEDRIVVPNGSNSAHGVLGPVPPFLPREAGVYTVHYENATGEHSATRRDANIVADTARFFAFTAPLPDARQRAPKMVYVLNKAARHWSLVKFPLSYPWPLLFGAWLSGNVSNLILRGHRGVGKPNENVGYSVIPQGKLLLQNLLDGRKLTINTGQQDSEILDVRKDGLVLYRVNNEIFEAHIEGDKLSAPKLVVKGEDVPEVHWVFWSKAGFSAQPAAKPAR